MLRQRGADYEVILNGVFLMATHGGASERELVRLALARSKDPRRVLIGGLGVGYSLQEALKDPAVEAVTVVELHAPVIAWNRTLLARHNGGALADARVQVVQGDLLAYRPDAPFGAVILDIDNGPGWTVREENASLYRSAGLARLKDWLLPGGCLAVWSAQRERGFLGRLRAALGHAEVHRVRARRGDDYIYLGVHR